MDISNWIDRHADLTADKTAIGFEGGDITYAELAEKVARLAEMLTGRLDVNRGDRIGFLGFNSPEFFALLFACARLGAIAVPLNWRLAPREHQQMLEDFTPKALFVEPEYVAHVGEIGGGVGRARLVAMGDPPDGWLSFQALLDGTAGGIWQSQGATYDDPVVICYTSGATGTPKGVVLTQNAVFYNAVNSTHMHEMTSEDRVLTNIPTFHVGGLNILTLPALHTGATVILRRQFDPGEAIDDLVNASVTLTVLVPAQIAAMIGHPNWAAADFSSVRMIDTGSTFVPSKLITAFHEKYVPVGNIYGSTETAPIATVLTRNDTSRLGSVGKSALHCEIRIVDDGGNDVPAGTPGEILVRGPNVMQGYWNKPEVTAEVLRDGWYHSADVAHFDQDGFLFIDDRKKDMIISGAENIYPAELENILADCPDLAEAAVVGRPDEKWGEVPVAVAVRREGCDIDCEAVVALFDGALARYKHPKDVIFVDALPRNAMGKVLKDELRQMVKG